MARSEVLSRVRGLLGRPSEDHVTALTNLLSDFEELHLQGMRAEFARAFIDAEEAIGSLAEGQQHAVRSMVAHYEKYQLVLAKYATAAKRISGGSKAKVLEMVR